RSGRSRIRSRTSGPTYAAASSKPTMATTTLTLAIPACHGASPPDQVAHQTAMTPATPIASSVTTLRHTPADWLASAAARPESSVAIGVFDADRLGRRA